ncbi:uncharacterized protein LOC128322342 [Hemicordylus capensis]|uniref:uncharacterized protein LOC128322342 n=1 Tax=Hemicordylus capensis TaxID=884348 RepID=UPI002304918B|nr:uncharacterized protein LOC128322342 [Hemicordylus capensis]
MAAAAELGAAIGGEERWRGSASAQPRSARPLRAPLTAPRLRTGAHPSARLLFLPPPPQHALDGFLSPASALSPALLPPQEILSTGDPVIRQASEPGSRPVFCRGESKAAGQPRLGGQGLEAAAAFLPETGGSPGAEACPTARHASAREWSTGGARKRITEWEGEAQPLPDTGGARGRQPHRARQRGLAYPPRCLLSIRFFCLTGCRGMLSVMAAAAELGAAVGGEERWKGSASARPRSARPLRALLTAPRLRTGLAAAG